jgi:predicted MPP superfamily phosphohydrolase
MPLIFIAILGVYQVLLFFVHAALYETLVAAFGWHATWLAWLFGILSLSFVTASILTHRSCNRIVVWYYRISAYWFGLVHFLFVGTFAFFILSLAIYQSGHYVSPAILGGLALGVMFLIHLYATWQTSRPKIVRVDIALPHLPTFWQGKKIVFFSDLHLGAVWDGNLARKTAAIIARESPEALFIGGDMFDGVKCHSEKSLAPFSALRPPQGIFFVTGNHEYIRDIEEFLSAIRASGIRILNNEVVDLKGIALAGVDWKDAVGAENYEKLLAGMAISREKPTILLKHEPSDLPIAEKFGISLQFSGHTHRGQIFPLGLITKRIYHGFDYGMKKLGGMIVYTSSGVGTWGPPLRFGTQSEVIVVTLH